MKHYETTGYLLCGFFLGSQSEKENSRPPAATPTQSYTAYGCYS